MGGADLIKTKVTVSFGRSGHNEAIALQHDLRAKGHAAELASDVHAQTLMAFAREKLKSGEPVDADKLGLFVGRTTQLKEPR